MPYEPERITVDAESVTIRWTDGASTTIGGDMLRSSCPCAECREYETKTRSIIQIGNRSSIADRRLCDPLHIRRRPCRWALLLRDSPPTGKQIVRAASGGVPTIERLSGQACACRWEPHRRLSSPSDTLSYSLPSAWTGGFRLTQLPGSFVGPGFTLPRVVTIRVNVPASLSDIIPHEVGEMAGRPEGGRGFGSSLAAGSWRLVAPNWQLTIRTRR